MKFNYIEHIPQWWNNQRIKPEIVDVEATPIDICAELKIDNLDLAFLLQRENEQNNIVCYRLSDKPDIRTIYAMHYFVYVLFAKYNIQFIRLNGRYKFCTKFATRAKDDSTFFIDIRESLPKLEEVLAKYGVEL